MEEKINYSSPSQADIAKLCKEAADLLENEVNIYDKSKSYQKVDWCSEWGLNLSSDALPAW